MADKVTWPADNIERRSVESLIPYARNARTHSEDQVAQIAASIREWGWTNPILCDETGGIIAGHGRVLAARKLGIKDVPVMTATGWTDAQKRAYILADNQLALNAGWDTELLKVELGELGQEGFNLDLIGFGDDFLANLLNDGTEGLTDPDDVPEAPEEPVSVVGDTWILGNHRIRCGDSTNPTDVDAVLNGVSPHLMVTDPPYGVNYDPNQRRRVDAGKTQRTYMSAVDDTEVEWRDVWALFPGDVAYIWHSDKQIMGIGAALIDAGFELRQQIIWAKNSLTLTRNHYRYQHEHCWYAVKKTAHWDGPSNSTTLWHIDKVNATTGHGAQKPVECMKRPIENNSSPGQAVYEPFSGSGTTIIAAEMTGRHCYAIELNPAYVDVAIKRWQDFTGQEAIHADTGESFNDRVEAQNGRDVAA